MRITSLYLKKWLQAEFKRLEIDVPVIECYKTRFRDQDYESGAATYIYRIGDLRCPSHVYIFIPKREIEECLATGYELYIKLRDHYYLNGAQVSLRKK